jgi:hypothetical protein
MSHFDNIGISARSREEFGTVMSEFFKLAELQSPGIETDRTYLWSDGKAKLWFHPDADWCIVPSFSTGTIVSFKALDWIDNSNNCSYCAIHDNSLLYPLALTFGDVKDAKSKIEIGTICKLRVMAFIENGRSWTNRTEYDSLSEPRLFAHGFFPLGPFSALESSRRNSPHALICGAVQSIEQFQNAQTGTGYRWLRIESSGYVYEAIVSNLILMDIVLGSIVQVDCWLCAELIS